MKSEKKYTAAEWDPSRRRLLQDDTRDTCDKWRHENPHHATKVVSKQIISILCNFAVIKTHRILVERH